jgi:hypothetical protein
MMQLLEKNCQKPCEVVKLEENLVAALECKMSLEH